MEEEILPQWSADEDDEALLKEASERGTSQQEELKNSASGAKRSLELYTPIRGANPKTARKLHKEAAGGREDLSGVPHATRPKASE